MLKLSLTTVNPSKVSAVIGLLCQICCQSKPFLKARLHDLAVHTHFIWFSPGRGGLQVVQKWPISSFGLTPNKWVGLRSHVFDYETWKSLLFPCYRLQTSDFWSSYNQNLKINILHPCSKFLASAKLGLAHYDSFCGGGSQFILLCISCNLFIWHIICYFHSHFPCAGMKIGRFLGNF